MTLWKVARLTRQAAQLNSARKHPARYVKNRAVSRGLGVLGFWSAFGKLWR
jgi:hypothetical protein